MTTKEVANRLVELCRQGQYDAAQEELYSSSAESIEPAHSQGLQTVHGLEAIKEKGHQFQSMIEAVHGGNISDPVIAGDKFAVAMSMDVTLKGQGRLNLDEIAVYDVKDGKITKEHFFY